jgi:two-component system response regulator PilR (NtrC family)
VSRILIVDDEEGIREYMRILLRRQGYEVRTADTRAAAAAELSNHPADVVLTDVKLPDGDGIEVLRHVKAASPETAVVVMTAFDDHDLHTTALRLGAENYLSKPIQQDELEIVIRQTIERRQLERENRLLKAEFRQKHQLENMIAVSAPMAAVFELVRSVAPTTSTVLVTGESGTGKELVAKALHALSPRHDRPFVSINCGALPDTLLESELFGHVRGAFTDAHQNKKGLFEAAHRGTLFLDEVGETSLAMQVKLLRALQDRRIRRVGGTDEVEVDARVVAATNRPLEQLVQERRFREDLYYRLNVIPVRLPPLRERRQDVRPLAQHFLERFSREMGKHLRGISSEALASLEGYGWPGNVRELENVIERAVALEPTPVVLIDRLPAPILGEGASRLPTQSGGDFVPGFQLDQHLNEIESTLLRAALARAAGDRAQAATLLGVTPRSLRYLIKKHLGSTA